MDLNSSIYYTIPDTALQVILRFVGAHNLEVIWRCIACNPYWYGWYCPGCKTPLRFLHWTPRFHFGYCGTNCGCCRTASGLKGCLICKDLKSWKVTSRDAREQLRHFNGLWCLWQFGYLFSWHLKQFRFLWVWTRQNSGNLSKAQNVSTSEMLIF